MLLEQGLAKVPGLKAKEAKISILNDISGIIKPSRMTLLLGPPGCGKTTLLRALAGQLDKSLKVAGEISYNGFRVKEFVQEKTAAYVSQYDLHIPEMTVRETLDFSARFQGVGSRQEIMEEVSKREKQAGIIPESDIDTYMKAISVEGLERSLQTDYILKIMGLDICSDTMIGDVMRRGISGGQKKRLTTAEIIVGPTKALFMDEISTGLDSSTTFQIISCFQQLAHITETTIVVSLLQPAPETYDLFDDIILMAKGKIVYHGPRNHILNFFEECGFKCPERKEEAEFLQEVLSRKDQEQYWSRTYEEYHYVSVGHLCKKFNAYDVGQRLEEELSKPYDKSQCHKNALSFNAYSLPKWELFKACMVRELLLMKRNSFVYIFKSTQLGITAIITMTIFLCTRLGVDVFHANSYLGALFYTLIIHMVNGFPELAMTITRLPVFYKQRDFYFYPAWAYAIPAFLLKIPISLIESLLWTSITYYGIGYSPEAVRFFRQFLLLLILHQVSLSLFRFLASYFQTPVASTVSGTLTFLVLLVFGGFILPYHSMPSWLKWGFWCSPLTYAEIGLAVNEFLAPRWEKITSANTTIGQQVLTSRGLNFNGYFYWISVGALVGYVLLLNVAFSLAITLRKQPGVSQAIISQEKLYQIKGEEDTKDERKLHDTSPSISPRTATEHKRTGRMVLPFIPLTVAFQDVKYYVDTPLEMREQGYTEKQLQLLHNITGTFRPGILTALMGVSGAGKTTLLDVLAGRKTGGTIEGDIRIGGYPKVQQTFARISGYCEQNDIHSPHITVEESVIYSAWLRLPSQVDPTTRSEFINEVLEIIELDGIKASLVGIPGVSGLSTEQRKRLTIAVELVANPSIIFMDEPTSGLDARAAAIVMRAVKNVVGTGRTVVCTIHQPSTDIFEAFDELILMKRGGELIYVGQLGQHSCEVIEYFEGITGIPRIKKNYNPATWMLDVTSTSVEAQLNVDFAQIYRQSPLYRNNQELVRQVSKPPPDSSDLHFPTRFPQNGWVQFKACLWKQYLSYWRSPSYNLTRMIFVIISSTVFAVLFWKHGKTLNNQQDLFNMLGLMYVVTNFFGINNASSVLTFVATERTVLYREKYAGMYSPWAYSLAQMVIEIPYVFIQVGLFIVITYPTIGYYWSAQKFLWFFFTMFCTLLTYVYLGMLIVSLTPNVQVASILQSPCYGILNLFSGFIIPGPQIPKWWIWLYYISPMSWTLNSLFTTQYGDIDKEIMVFGETKLISSFIKDYFGYHHDRLGVVAVVLIAYPLILGSLFAFCIEKLNFQRR
ncbi:ABC transporter G family member 41-like isoform X1 [Asparagus officinalis]|uniref:ABC transporter G family member 41-like isoform X1 n=1 Tax=Asparagus officinalis TaxID=4686 RepID=UPI00098E7E67|nr:ABC transporter G family member 41-like isoform X1 [Asparagus officinalis]